MASEFKGTKGEWKNNCFLVVATSRPGGLYGGQEICHTGGGRCDSEEAEANAELIAEAGTVLHTTGKTPRELAGEVERLERERGELLSALNAYCAAEAMPTTAPFVQLTERTHEYLSDVGGGECSKYGRWYGVCHSCNREREELQEREDHAARRTRDDALSVASRELRILLARVNQPAATANVGVQ